MASYDDKEVTLADIPGLIENAHNGVGLGIKFLKHIERCKTLLHLIDASEANLEKSYKQVRRELGKYSKKLLDKEEVIVFNKIDLLKDEEIDKKKKIFTTKIKKEILMLSTLDKELVSKFKSKIIKYVS